MPRTDWPSSAAVRLLPGPWKVAAWVTVLLVLLLLSLCALGYGSDNDTYTVLDAGRSTWQMHVPDTSRNPGYWVFEAIVYVLARGGGYVATNLASLAVGLLLLWRFDVIARRLEMRHPLLLAASLVAVPVFAIACTSTDDYLWSLLGIVVFAECLVADRGVLAIVAAAFAFALRAANGVVLAGAIAGALTLPVVCGHRISRHSLKVLCIGFAALLIGGLPYLASYRLAGNSFAFTQALMGPSAMWSAKMRIGRFVYKCFYLFGPLATVYLAGMLVSARRAGRRSSDTPYSRSAIPIFLGSVLANLLLFLKYPIEISYLLPAAYFGLLLVGAAVMRTRIEVLVLLAAIGSFNVVSPQIAAPDRPGHATSARLHPAIGRGPLLEDIALRRMLRDCADYQCFYRRMHSGEPGAQPQPKPIE